MAINPIQGPIDYLGMMPQIDPGAALLRGLQLGSAIRGMRQQRQQEEEALALREKYKADLQKAIAQAKQEKAVLLKFEHQNGRSSWSMSVNGRVLTGASN